MVELVDYLTKAVAKTRASFSGNRDSWVDYLTKYDLRGYFADASDKDRVGLKGALEKKVDAAVAKYDKQLGGITRKLGSKGAMGLAVANDIYAYLSPTASIMNATGLGYALFAAKTLAEAPAMYKYFMKSKDWYGVGMNLVLKPARYLLPVIGPALESGAFDRMVRRRVMKEAAADFIKDYGQYRSFEERMREQLKTPIKDVIQFPQQPKTKAA